MIDLIMSWSRSNLLFACFSVFTILTPTALSEEVSTSVFLSRHWQRPLEHQGKPPASFSDLETSLNPSACGNCHPQQFQDWQSSLHAHAMGPGLLGQLMDMNPDDRTEHQVCLRCHAPLAEQADEVVAWLSDGETGAINTPEDTIPSSTLYNQGLICAGCHLRNYQVYGPNRNNALPSSMPPGETVAQPHDGWQSEDAFKSSEFCAACHQYEADGYALNGKLIENTFEEWRISPQAKEGKSCQSCHMPDRRHLWRGIHDRATVLSGVEIKLHKFMANNEHVSGVLTLTNTEVGHQFPTYVTPRVVMSAYQQDTHEQLIPGTQREIVVARQVSLDLKQELSDTRLAPGQTASLVYEVLLHPEARSILFQIQVEPDSFYRDFYRATLESDSNNRGAAILRRALHTAEASSYTLFLQEISL